MNLLSKRMKAISRGLGLMGLVSGLIVVIQQVALAAGDTSVPKPYYYGSYPGPPTWFWILVFPGFVAALVFPLANGWLNSAYKEANAKLRDQRRG
jgi:hypothetical protein